MIYPTIKAVVHRGKVKLLDDVHLPENAALLITVLEENALNYFSLGEHLTAGLQDILSGQITEIATTDELEHHLDAIFYNS